MLISIEGIWSDNELTALGSERHARVHESSVEVRGNLRIVRGLRLRSLELGLIGMADAVEFRAADTSEEARCATLPGIPGRWISFPVEYKKGAIRQEPGYEVQVCAQALCLEEMLHSDVPAGAIFFGDSARRREVVFDSQLRERTRNAARRFHELVAAGETPRASPSRKCPKCSLVEVCLPDTSRLGSVSRYIRRSLDTELSYEETP